MQFGARKRQKIHIDEENALKEIPPSKKDRTKRNSTAIATENATKKNGALIDITNKHSSLDQRKQQPLKIVSQSTSEQAFSQVIGSPKASAFVEKNNNNKKNVIINHYNDCKSFQEQSDSNDANSIDDAFKFSDLPTDDNRLAIPSGPSLLQSSILNDVTMTDWNNNAEVNMTSTSLNRSSVIDIDTTDNYSSNYEYSKEIYQYMKKISTRFLPCGNYMDRQIEVNKSMRHIMIDWMFEVSVEYKLSRDTLYMAVNLVDRFLSVYISPKSKLQLVGVTCLYIAAKYHELATPNIEDYVYITDHTYTGDQIIQLELYILVKLDWNLSVVLQTEFMDRYLCCIKADLATTNLANYFSDLSLLSYDCISLSPAKNAVSCVCCSLYILQKQPYWNSQLRYHSELDLKDIAEPCKLLLQAFRQMTTTQTQTTLKDKYASANFSRVSLLALPSYEMSFDGII